MEALSQPDSEVEIDGIRVMKDLPAGFRKELRALATSRGIDVEIAARQRIHEISEAPRHDQGVVARIRLRRLSEVEVFVSANEGSQARHAVRLLALDGVTNSQNIGMVVRSAVAAGIDGIVWPLVGSPWVNGLVIKSSAATIYRCNIQRCDTLADGLHRLGAAGFELAGISSEIDALLDRRLGIPLGPGAESLNVSVAAALACFKGMGIISGRAQDRGADERVD